MSQPTARENQVNIAGIKLKDRSTDLLYPTAGQAIEKRESSLLPVIEVQHLTHAPTLKSWMGSREGKVREPDLQPIVDALKATAKNGATIHLNVDTEGYYDYAFSGSNGNMVRLTEVRSLLKAGFSFGEVLWITKQVCGPSGYCDNGKPCQQCLEIGKGALDGKEYVPEPKPVRDFVSEEDEFTRQVNAVLSQGPFMLINKSRILCTGNRKSASLAEIREACVASGKGVTYVLDMLGIYRQSEAESNTALKRADLGGH